MNSVRLIHLFSLCAISWSVACGDDAEFTISPATINLHAEEDSQQVLVTEIASRLDLTRSVRYEIAEPAIAAVTDNGRVNPVTSGSTTLRVINGERVQSIPVQDAPRADATAKRKDKMASSSVSSASTLMRTTMLS